MRNKIFYVLMLTALFMSCESVPQSVDQTWTEEMFFKQAQEAVDNNLLSTALFYYQVFLVRFPEDHAKVIAAEYESAVLQKKLGAEDLAITGLKKVLEQYETSTYVILYPPRYKVLAEKVLADLEGKPVEPVDPDKYPARKTGDEQRPAP